MNEFVGLKSHILTYSKRLCHPQCDGRFFALSRRYSHPAVSATTPYDWHNEWPDCTTLTLPSSHIPSALWHPYSYIISFVQQLFPVRMAHAPEK